VLDSNWAETRAVGWAIAMGTFADILHFRPVAGARIVLVCPHCGQEAQESAEKLRGNEIYHCRGDGCDYRFDLMVGARKDYLDSFAKACRRFYATFLR
jgi:hypothetical protein